MRSHLRSVFLPALLAVGLPAVLVVAFDGLQANDPQVAVERRLAPLGTVPVPEPHNLGQFVRNRSAAIQLGKALFWDMQMGSDNIQACASCHFHAGADAGRAKNQLSPGLLAGDETFQVGGPNYTLQPRDFPFTRHADPEDGRSPITSDKNDVASSQGVFNHDFLDVNNPAGLPDNCKRVDDAVFQVRGVDVRRVEPRNTPTVINAVFNFRNFWDGRANERFNGVNPFGPRDRNARIYKVVDGRLRQVSIEIPLSSLASQAVGPPRSSFEASCAGRAFAQIGKKLLAPGVIPLGKQIVHPNDSRLGLLAASLDAPSLPGLRLSYANMIRRAFRPEYWSSDEKIEQGEVELASELSNDLLDLPIIDGLLDDRFTQMEANFALFFGLAVQLYESTLIADQTPFDEFLAGDDGALTSRQKAGFSVFKNEGKCVNCHGGPELTNASVGNVRNQRLERMIMGDNGCAIYDNGFYNIGVRPTREDLGVGGKDPFGKPLSDTRQAMQGRFSDSKLEPPLGRVPECDDRAAVDGAFKTPGLRLAELTGPYFHNGGQATLRQVVDFYDRGADFANRNRADLDPDIQRLGLSEKQKVALVDFLVALTDERVRRERAPFDHPQLCVPDGNPLNEDLALNDGTGKAADSLRCIPPVGAEGSVVPLRTFLDLSPFQG